MDSMCSFNFGHGIYSYSAYVHILGAIMDVSCNLSPENLCRAKEAKMQRQGDNRSYMQVLQSLFLLITGRTESSPVCLQWQVEWSVLQSASSSTRPNTGANAYFMSLWPGFWGHQGVLQLPLSQVRLIWETWTWWHELVIHKAWWVLCLMFNLSHHHGTIQTCRVPADLLTTNPDWTRCLT